VDEITREITLDGDLTEEQIRRWHQRTTRVPIATYPNLLPLVPRTLHYCLQVGDGLRVEDLGRLD
jgi:hypothetical protein